MKMSSDQWAGIVFALLVVVPAALLPKFVDSESLLQLRYSMWAGVPVFGGILSGWILRRRLLLAFFGGLAGFSCFWCAATWGAGSEATSVYEALAATGVGVFPVFLLYRFCRPVGKAKSGVDANASQHSVTPFGQILKQFWKQTVIFGSAFLVLTVITVSDINDLETGAVDSVRLWAPIASIYERFGYWPAVLLVPSVGVLCGAFLCWSLMKRGTLESVAAEETGP